MTDGRKNMQTAEKIIKYISNVAPAFKDFFLITLLVLILGGSTDGRPKIPAPITTFHF